MLDASADPNAQSHKGWTPMHQAVRYFDVSYTDVIKLLIKAKADLDGVDPGGHTPLEAAKKYGFDDVVDLLEGMNRAAPELSQPEGEGSVHSDDSELERMVAEDPELALENLTDDRTDEWSASDEEEQPSAEPVVTMGGDLQNAGASPENQIPEAASTTFGVAREACAAESALSDACTFGSSKAVDDDLEALPPEASASPE
eukprot:TRINITY_DN11265_c0_g1_i4.p1 TRINITY_DN11265_c0_g1~~TRINITY_DN11265_c0_g1_i4.p1  ORF type:complete len:201 (-),score=51.27 TRINITY_DN11265_c0_g1_i4:120-722(-)